MEVNHGRELTRGYRKEDVGRIVQAIRKGYETLMHDERGVSVEQETTRSRDKVARTNARPTTEKSQQDSSTDERDRTDKVAHKYPIRGTEPTEMTAMNTEIHENKWRTGKKNGHTGSQKKADRGLKSSGGLLMCVFCKESGSTVRMHVSATGRVVILDYEGECHRCLDRHTDSCSKPTLFAVKTVDEKLHTIIMPAAAPHRTKYRLRQPVGSLRTELRNVEPN
ncbi:unnamed protein product [Strongylus vulgaris]|uniref:Uncharacterized protein n=1 Tax=Strongylus vulgaris TaxID=40348 RepID=A0A3P7JK37_STRVU|nr:unnamed protein product [Strongylus vulgaris]